MNITPMDVQFSENIDQEVLKLVDDMGLMPITDYLTQAETDPVMKSKLVTLLTIVSDIFSVDVPDMEDTPELTLERSVQDLRLSKLFRERGLFRLYRVLHEMVDDVPLFMYFSDPETGEPFAKQEHFLGWFCRAAKIPRALVFMRMAAIERLETLNFSMSEAYKTVIEKPYAIHESLRMVADWEKGGVLKDINPQVAINIAQRTDPDLIPEIERLAKIKDQDPESHQEYMDLVVPQVADLIREVASHERAGEALDYVRHDILKRPEIAYYWDEEGDALEIRIIYTEVDPQGNEFELPATQIAFVPDITSELPLEIKRDLVKRLPIKNRSNLDLD